MDILKIIDELALQARRERVPATDVSSRVLQRIAVSRKNPCRVLTLFAAASSLAACLILYFGLRSWMANDLEAELFAPMKPVVLYQELMR